MKHLKIFGLGTVAAMVMTAFTTGSASATTLEIGGVAKNEAVAIEASLKSGTSIVMSRTDGSLANTCTASSLAVSTTSPFTTEDVGGPVSSLSYTSCTRTVTVHKSGALTFRRISGTTNLTIFETNSEVTVGSPFGTLNCKTDGAHHHIGVFTGLSPPEAGTWHLTVVKNCGFLVPSAQWAGTYTVTSPKGLGGVE